MENIEKIFKSHMEMNNQSVRKSLEDTLLLAFPMAVFWSDSQFQHNVKALAVKLNQKIK